MHKAFFYKLLAIWFIEFYFMQFALFFTADSVRPRNRASTR
jgi:hypothetical protein